jgi:hypothetical protein
MKHLRKWLKRFTGPETKYKESPQYIAINLAYRYYVDAGQLNDYILFSSPQDFNEWVEENVAKRDQDGWKLYAPCDLTQPHKETMTHEKNTDTI